MVNKSPNKSMLTRLDSIIKEIEGPNNNLPPGGLKLIGKITKLLKGKGTKKAKGGIIKKRYGGSVKKKTKKKK